MRSVKRGGFVVETDREVDGRWIADVPELPGCMVYADSRETAVERAVALARRVREEQEGELARRREWLGD